MKMRDEGATPDFCPSSFIFYISFRVLIMSQLPELSPDERSRYEWQLWISGFGEAGQRRLKAATVFISRIGGVGGTVAMQLAAAGIGRLILAHAGDLRLNDLNRQLLMTTGGIGKPRIESAMRQLHDLNPHVAVESIGENVSATNVERLVGSADVIVSAAPLFEERLQMNREAVRRGVPMVDCAMYELEGRLTTIVPGRTPCLSCMYPDPPPTWKRDFPVIAPVSSMVGSLGAMEVIKLVADVGELPSGQVLNFDLRDMTFTKIAVGRRADCAVCGSLKQIPVH
jgi:molybdopterin/thiamine biosynthesis adenylyltransferase